MTSIDRSVDLRRKRVFASPWQDRQKQQASSDEAMSDGSEEEQQQQQLNERLTYVVIVCLVVVSAVLFKDYFQRSLSASKDHGRGQSK
ncbi:hypothetical protein NL676_020528 [Syzygium grande]|nr:hypothetical protein NL676_020528 [Syzygium grande]